MNSNAGVTDDRQQPVRTPRPPGGRPFALRSWVTARRTLVTVHGPLGEATAQHVYDYLDEVIRYDRRPVTVRISRASSCDAYGVRALARAACRAEQAGQPFVLSGPALTLLQIMKTAEAGYVFLRWPTGSRLEWADPQGVVARLGRLGQPEPQPEGRR